MDRRRRLARRVAADGGDHRGRDGSSRLALLPRPPRAGGPDDGR